jgi:hypothetical protein
VIASTDPELLTGVVLRELADADDPAPDAQRRQEWEAGLDQALRAIHLI